jgi:formylglycine-generating enzyme required for sulfatase activity
MALGLRGDRPALGRRGSETWCRLLTEAEWEYACRATSTTAFCNGAITNTVCSPLDSNLDQVGWYCGNASNMTHDVGGKTANAWGLKDMHGIVWKWCWDWWGTYPTSPLMGPTGPASGSSRVKRGGSWYDCARYCRSANRGYYNPEYAYNGIGLRLSTTAQCEWPRFTDRGQVHGLSRSPSGSGSGPMVGCGHRQAGGLGS